MDLLFSFVYLKQKNAWQEIFTKDRTEITILYLYSFSRKVDTRNSMVDSTFISAIVNWESNVWYFFQGLFSELLWIVSQCI